MELGSQLKKYRASLNLSQEELAEKIYVTRQTVSNWENEKSYPDIHSLLSLSSLFQVSLDQLIKGDVEIMREKISEEEIKKFYKYGTVYSVLLVATFLSVIPVILWANIYVVVGAVLIFAATLYFAFKVERIKKDNDIHTYKEIVAFTEGKRLDEIDKQREYGKRPYQKFLLAVGSGLIVIAIAVIVGFLRHR